MASPNLSVKGFGVVRAVDLGQGIRRHLPAEPVVSLRAFLGALVPDVPKFKVSFATAGGIIATWNADARASSYEVQQTQDINTLPPLPPAEFESHLMWHTVYTGLGPTTTFANPGGSWQFTFRARASNAIGTSGWAASGLSQTHHDPPPAPPAIDFYATPADPPGSSSKNARINIGESATLHWKVSNCTSCAISLQGKDYDTKKIVLNVPSLSSSGTMIVTPAYGISNWIEYTLTASGSNGTTKSARTVSVYYPPNNSPPQVQAFWFKMSNPQSVLSCFTVGLYAADASAAQQAAQTYLNQGGYVGYTITALSGEGEATTACH